MDGEPLSLLLRPLRPVKYKYLESASYVDALLCSTLDNLFVYI